MTEIITERALFARVERVLANQNLRLHRCRVGSKNYPTLGRYFVSNMTSNIVDLRYPSDLNDLAELVGIKASIA